MHEYRVLRDILRRQMRRAVGSNPYGDRLTVSQTNTSALDAEIMAMPINGDRKPIMNVDGSWHFMLGFSVLGGPDVLA
jgi:hypothetical protein